MIEFFKGWRRKTGCVTLVLACLFAIGWIRSLTELQALFRLNENDTHLFVSVDGNISWERIWPIPKPRQSRWVYKRNKIVGSSDPDEVCDVHWNVTGFGFDFRTFSKLERAGGVAPYTQEFALWQVPYWSITIPLTLVSGWLLLIKQRTKPTANPPHG